MNNCFGTVELNFILKRSDIPEEILNYCLLNNIDVCRYLSALFCSFDVADLLHKHSIYSEVYKKLKES